MFLFGVINCSPDSLHEASIVDGVPAARARIDWLQSEGAEGLDVGGQGSTPVASLVTVDEEWERMAGVVDAAVDSAEMVSVDSWRPEVMRRALELGANVMNAADGMSTPESWALAAEFQPLVVLPFVNGPNPLDVTLVEGDPLDVMCDYFEDRLAVAARHGLRDRCLLDPGTGFGPAGWDWSDRYLYQRHVYTGLERLRTFGLPLYIPLPWKHTEDHDELLDIIIGQRPEFGRSHEPDRVRSAERRHPTPDEG
ncbi:N/A [soil metagenome]